MRMKYKREENEKRKEKKRVRGSEPSVFSSFSCLYNLLLQIFI